MKGYPLLYFDAAVNLMLGIALLFFRPALVAFIGVPPSASGFYPNVLGGVLFGIGLALLMECFRGPKGLVGLGLGGAVSINLCGGIVLAIWLLSGRLSLPLRGFVLMWGLVVLLMGISGMELAAHRR
jgi:hypothetical protein